MNTTTVAVDLAKDVFELAYSDGAGRITDRKRPSRKAFPRLFENCAPMRVVMEACGSAYYWARRLQALGHTVVLLPAHDVRPYVRRNKTDRTDAAGLLEADRCASIHPVPIKTPEQQSVQGMHRIREQHKTMRTALINVARGLLREFGIIIPEGSLRVTPAVMAALEDGDNELGMGLRHALSGVLEQIVAAEAAIAAIEVGLKEFLARDGRSQRMQRACGVGLITATALSASVGDFDRFPTGRHFASSLGLAPREHSSGRTRRLGRISKRGDIYLRTLLIHGARSVLCAAKAARRKGNPIDPLRTWALDLADRVGHNKAAVALANKLARRLWAAEHHRTSFDPNHISVRKEEASAA